MSTIQRDPENRVQVLDEEGNVVGEPPELDEATLLDIYRDMKLSRHFDERAVSLQRQGRMGTYPPLSGQEGAQIGSAHALAEEDELRYVATMRAWNCCHEGEEPYDGYPEEPDHHRINGPDAGGDG